MPWGFMRLNEHTLSLLLFLYSSGCFHVLRRCISFCFIIAISPYPSCAYLLVLFYFLSFLQASELVPKVE